MPVPIHSLLVGFNNRYIYNKPCQCRYTVYWSIIDIYIINHASADTPCTGQMIPWGTNSLPAEISTQ